MKNSLSEWCNINNRDDLLKQWSEKNSKSALEVSYNSNEKVLWICEKGHEWLASIYNRTQKNTNCPYCSNYYVYSGFNDLQTIYPQLASEFDCEKNGVLPSEVSAYGAKKYWWNCDKGHSYIAGIHHRTVRNHGCPYCSGHQVMEGFNDIATTNPEIAYEWDDEKNGDNKPTMYSKGSSYNAWWKCYQGHSFQAKIVNRCKGRGCPYCSGKKVITGVNDLETVYPELAKEWHPTKNKYITPNQVFSKTGIKYWWMCSHGHEWQQSPHLRSKGRGCPICSNELHVSFPEKVLYYYIQKNFNDVKQNYNPGWKSQRNIDIYIPELNVGIEYDGQAWHKDVASDVIKNDLCKENGILLIRIREKNCPDIPKSSSFDYRMEKDDYEGCFNFIAYILHRELHIDIKFEIDLFADRAIINRLVLSSEKENNITITNPTQMLEWDYEKNGNLKPEFLTRGSTKKVWWKCSKGHSWLAMIGNRCTKDRGCPYCNNSLPEVGVNDLETTNKDILDWWDYNKNSKKPSEYVKGSGVKVWWICDKGHSFERPIRNMVKNKKCPVCSKNVGDCNI